MRWKLIVLIACGGLTARAGNIDPAARFGYDANAGWIDFSPTAAAGVTVGTHFLTGYAYAANYGWIHFGNGPANGFSYPGTGTGQGVTVDPAGGALGGRANGANIGWINFGWAGGNDPNAPRINAATGAFSGYAYGANIGWIHLGGLKSSSLALTDSDSDGIDDAWEHANFGGLAVAGIGTDFDKDGQSDASEAIANTLPKDGKSWLRVTLISVSPGKTASSVTFTSSPTRLYKVRTSATLAPAAWADVAALGQFAGTMGSPTTTVTFSHPADAVRFHQVVALRY